jgi:phage terminase large subunit-like protein
MDIPALQLVLDRMGISAFRRELQHETDQVDGGIFGHVTFRHCAWDEIPPLDRIVVWVDPAVTDTDQSDAHGIQADGIAGTRENGTVYRLWSWEARTSPDDSLRRAILKAVELKAECVGVETDQGGDTWESAYKAVWGNLVASGAIPLTVRMPKFRQDKAGAGHGPKAHRAGQMLVDYEQGRIVHVLGTHDALERSLRRFLIRKPYDLVDAAYWSWFDLRGPKLKRTARSF